MNQRAARSRATKSAMPSNAPRRLRGGRPGACALFFTVHKSTVRRSYIMCPMQRVGVIPKSHLNEQILCAARNQGQVDTATLSTEQERYLPVWSGSKGGRSITVPPMLRWENTNTPIRGNREPIAGWIRFFDRRSCDLQRVIRCLERTVRCGWRTDGELCAGAHASGRRHRCRGVPFPPRNDLSPFEIHERAL